MGPLSLAASRAYWCVMAGVAAQRSSNRERSQCQLLDQLWTTRHAQMQTASARRLSSRQDECPLWTVSLGGRYLVRLRIGSRETRAAWPAPMEQTMPNRA